MNRPLGMKKTLARLTYPLRQRRWSIGSGPASAPSMGGLEADVRRLEAGWRQHIPKILDAISVSQHDASMSDEVHARIDALREDMDRLSERVNANYADIEKRLTNLEDSTRR